MSDLIAVAYDNRDVAERVRDELAQLTREHVIEIADAVVVTREGNGKVKLHQTVNPAGAGAVGGALWGGLIRICVLQHVTWSINSVCHVWGTSPYQSRDDSKNNYPIAVLSLGEGWHNNHHAFPTSARHGLRWWQFDASWCVLLAMRATGLVWDVRLPSEAAMAAKRRG